MESKGRGIISAPVKVIGKDEENSIAVFGKCFLHRFQIVRSRKAPSKVDVVAAPYMNRDGIGRSDQISIFLILSIGNGWERQFFP